MNEDDDSTIERLRNVAKAAEHLVRHDYLSVDRMVIREEKLVLWIATKILRRGRDSQFFYPRWSKNRLRPERKVCLHCTTVDKLVAAGKLTWGNKSRTFAIPVKAAAE